MIEEAFARRDDVSGLLYLRIYRLLALMDDQPRYWMLIDRMNFPALPVQHLYYEKEQEMRFGKARSD